jgi:hypothetical protein
VRFADGTLSILPTAWTSLKPAPVPPVVDGRSARLCPMALRALVDWIEARMSRLDDPPIEDQNREDEASGPRAKSRTATGVVDGDRGAAAVVEQARAANVDGGGKRQRRRRK